MGKIVNRRKMGKQGEIRKIGSNRKIQGKIGGKMGKQKKWGNRKKLKNRERIGKQGKYQKNKNEIG